MVERLGLIGRHARGFRCCCWDCCWHCCGGCCSSASGAVMLFGSDLVDATQNGKKQSGEHTRASVSLFLFVVRFFCLRACTQRLRLEI